MFYCQLFFFSIIIMFYIYIRLLSLLSLLSLLPVLLSLSIFHSIETQTPPSASNFGSPPLALPPPHSASYHSTNVVDLRPHDPGDPGDSMCSRFMYGSCARRSSLSSSVLKTPRNRTTCDPKGMSMMILFFFCFCLRLSPHISMAKR